MLTTFPQTPAHWVLYGFAGCLTENQADSLAEPFLKLRAKARRDLPADGLPSTNLNVEVRMVFPFWARTPAHWVLYALVASLDWDQACYIRRPLLDLCETALVGGDLSKALKAERPKALKAGKRSGGAR